MTIYLNTPKVTAIQVDNVDEAVELLKKLGEKESDIHINLPPINIPYQSPAKPYWEPNRPYWYWDPYTGPYYTTCTTNTTGSYNVKPNETSGYIHITN